MVEKKKTNLMGAQRVERANYSGLIISDLSALYKILRSNPDGKAWRDVAVGVAQRGEVVYPHPRTTWILLATHGSYETRSH